MAAIPASALAANLGANCGAAGGAFYAQSEATNWQDHTHDGLLTHCWYYGHQFRNRNWGFEAGWETGTVNGPSLTLAGATCLT